MTALADTATIWSIHFAPTPKVEALQATLELLVKEMVWGAPTV
jgi:hypothetical protein